MPEPPAGTVTFLFTDVEGSTRLLEHLGREDYRRLLADHHRLLREAFDRHGGFEVDTQGDAFFVVFTTAGEAVAAAVAAQRALAHHSWPAGAQPRVRMGLHTGEALLSEGRYVGVAVHRAQRVSAAAHGGQVLVSGPTREMVADELPAGVRLRDLGDHRLKDLDRPVHLFQVESEGLPTEFPPIRTEAPAAFDKADGLRRLVPRTRRSQLLAAGAAAAVLAAVVGGVVLVRGEENAPAIGPGDALAAIDPGSGEVRERLSVGRTPSAVAVGEGAVWVLSADEQTISRVDPNTSESQPFAVGATPTDLAVGAGALWVGAGSTLQNVQAAGPIATALIKVDPENRTQRGRTELPREGGAISNLTEQHIAVGKGAVWTVNPDYSISRIDPQTGSVVRTVRSFAAYAVAADGDEVWAIGEGGSVARIDPATYRVRRVNLRATTLGALAVGEGSVWITAPQDGTLWRIELGAGGRPSSIPVGQGALGVAVGPGSVWVANTLSGTVVRVSPSSNAVEHTVDVAGIPRALAVGEGALWVTVTGRGGTVAATGSDSEGLPRSFCEKVFFGGGEAPDFLIASDFPLQGGQRISTVQMSQAIAYVLRRRNFKAGRYRIGYQSCDDSIARTGQFDEDKCAANARAYAANRKVIGVVGTLNSPCALEEVPILNRAPGGGLAMISPLNSTIGLTRTGPGVPGGLLAQLYPTGRRNYVRVYPTDDYEAAGLALLARQLGARRVAVLHDGEQFFSQPLVESFRVAALRLGRRVTSVRRWNPRARSYVSLARLIARERPQAVFLSGLLDSNGGQVVRDLRAVLGRGVPLLGTGGFTPISFLFERAGPAAKGMYVSLLGVVPQRLGPRARRFIDEFGAAQQGVEVEPSALYAAQAAEVLLDAIARSDGTRRGVIEELFRTRVNGGILGTFRFDRNGDTTLNQVTILRAERPGGRTTVMSFDGAAVDRVLVPPPSLVDG